MGERPGYQYLGSLIARIPAEILESIRVPQYYESIRDAMDPLAELVNQVERGEHDLSEMALMTFRGVVEFAGELLLTRPNSIGAPSLDVRDDGRIEFEWYESPRQVVSFVIGPDWSMVCSGIRERAVMTARSIFVGSWPKEIVSTISAIAD
jgi:hypothetical protein